MASPDGREQILSPTALQIISTALLSTAALFLLLAHGQSRLTLRAQANLLDHRTDAVEFRGGSERPLPSLDPTWVQALGLNYSTFHADLFWIGGVVDHGEARRNSRIPRQTSYYMEMARLADPRFARIYQWYPDAYIGAKGIVSHEDLERVNRFIDLGIEEFPSASTLPYRAALNYIGFSHWHTPEQRLEQARKAVEYLRRVSQLRDVPANTPLLLDYFEQQIQKIEGGDLEPLDEERFARLYLLTPDDQVRQRIRTMLKERGADVDALLAEPEALIRQERQQREASLYDMLYLDLWMALFAQDRL